MSADEERQISSEHNSGDLIATAKGEKKATSPYSRIIKTDDSDVDGVSLVEDDFAQYYDENGTRRQIKRFTWKNKNHIQIEIINYGARVISIKMPDRSGEIEDILLGFDDLAGYLFYDKLYFGSVIGRVSNIVKNSTFAIKNKKYNVSSNYGKHSINGGSKGLDKAVWDTYIAGKKVIMSHISPHLSEGYPGSLLVRAIFELSPTNEFKVNFDAQTTGPTYVDLSHLLYFNLAGHYAGPNEIYRHILTLNCNCFTPEVDKIPTGEIFNVIHTPFDFQIPKILGKVMGIKPKDGFNQNLCVNRGMHQNECFVGRIFHPPSGRMLEIYTNQPGLQLNTANHFGYGKVVLAVDEIGPSDLKCKPDTSIEKSDKCMLLFQKVHEKVVDLLKLDKKQNFEEIMQLIQKFYLLKNGSTANLDLKITPMQSEYLKKAREVICENEETDDECLDLKEALSTILKTVTVTESQLVAKTRSSSKEDVMEKPNFSSKKSSGESKLGILQSSEKIAKENSKSSKINQAKQSKSNSKKLTENTIPVYYKNSDLIRGKGRALYQTHGGISLQSQNYPNSVNIKHFPNAILNPGEIYKHDIVYRFWIRAGNPNKWIKRNFNESKQRTSGK